METCNCLRCGITIENIAEICPDCLAHLNALAAMVEAHRERLDNPKQAEQRRASVWQKYAPADYRKPFTAENVPAEELGLLLLGIRHWHRTAGAVTFDGTAYTVHSAKA